MIYKYLKSLTLLNTKSISKSRIGICFGLFIALIMIVLIPESFSVLGSNQIYDLDEHIYGKNYSEWGGQWWLFLSNFTSTDVPAGDNTGGRCNDKQIDPNMFFLFGTFGNQDKITRECTVPSSKAILVPVLVSECSDLERKSLDTPENRRNCVYEGTKENVNKLNFSLDGIPLTNVTNYFTEIPLNVTLKGGNAWGVDPGDAMAHTGGYYVILKPLSPGKHTIAFDADKSGTGAITIDLEYNLNVINSTNH